MKTAPLPPIIYGTAWKEAETAEFVIAAVNAGFRGIDTANQKKHYREDFVGDALLILKGRGISRDDLFLQSKYTYPRGQDHRLPYNPADNFAAQVKSSLESTLKNLHTDYLDSFLLHGPSSPVGLTNNDLEVWGTMEELCESGKTRMIGVSNVELHHLQAFCDKARIKPAIVQNRCYAADSWDSEIREYCLEQGIIYQGFSLLTANPQVMRNPQLAAIAKRLNVTPAQVIFRFTMQIGILPLTGTTDPQHMKDDLAAAKITLSEADLEIIHNG